MFKGWNSGGGRVVVLQLGLKKSNEQTTTI